MRWRRKAPPPAAWTWRTTWRFAWIPVPMSAPRVWLWLEPYWSLEQYERLNFEFGTCGWVSYERWPAGQ